MMKSVIKILALSLLAILSSCRKETEKPVPPSPSPVPEMQTIHYKATVQTGTDTRATVDNLKYEFEEGDRVYMASVDANGDADGNLYGFLSLSVTGGVGKNVALFEGDLNCKEGFTPSLDTNAPTTVKLVLVSPNDNLHTESVLLEVTVDDYKDKSAESLNEAVRRLSHFTGEGNFGDLRFTLNQQSSFLVMSLSFDPTKVTAGATVTANLVNHYDEPTHPSLGAVSCQTVKVDEDIKASWVFAFPSGTELSDAKLVVNVENEDVPPLRMANATLLANTYYTFQRATYIMDYVTVEATEANTEITFNYAAASNGIQYSTDGYEWLNYNGSITLSAVGDKVYFRGKANSFKNTGSTPLLSTGDKACYVYGDIMFLMCNEKYKPRTSIPANNAFQGAFKNCTWLRIKEGKELKLSATTLTESCYESMFESCSNLTAGISIPATEMELPKACFKAMFKNTGLTSAPSINATSMGESACESMFNDCKALTTVPALSVSNMSKKGCYQMFYNCTSLSSVSLTISSLAAVASGNHEGCKEMFYGCNSLESANNITLSAPTLYTACYYSMFQGCTSLTLTPALPATSLATECYRNMFYGCSAITTAPSLNATTLAESCYYSMFYGCTSLSTSDGPIFLPASTLVTNCYREMFYGASGVDEVVCLATDKSASNCTNNWLYNVANSGTFWKVSGVDWGTGASDIPNGWITKEYGVPIFPDDPPFDGEIDL